MGTGWLLNRKDADVDSMDASGGAADLSGGPHTPPPPPPQNLLTPIHLLSIEPLINRPPLLLRDVFNLNHAIRQRDESLLNLLLTSHLDSNIQSIGLLTPHNIADPLPNPDLAPAAPAPAPIQMTATPAETPAPAEAPAPAIIPWSERSLTPPPKGVIRFLSPPPTDVSDTIVHLWDTDYTLTEWNTRCENDPVAGEVFVANQRARWRAWKVWYRLTQRIWRRRTQCNVDMIDMATIPDADAILMSDTTHRIIYRFHRRDLFNTLLSNICMSEEMLPNPRAPRNPWTNAPFTYGQIVGVCQLLLQDYARRGRCPPVLFSAFWASKFDVRRFASEHASLLSQHAIMSYFKDINDHNHDTITDTINTLLADAGVSFTPVGVRRWLRATPLTEGHREWLAMARDYTLYMNLHVQVRPHWHSEDMIFRDVRRLHQRFRITDSAGPRLRMLREMGATPGPGIVGATMEWGGAPASTAAAVAGAQQEAAVQNLLTLLLGPQSPNSVDDAMSNIQNSLFGGRGTGGRG